MVKTAQKREDLDDSILPLDVGFRKKRRSKDTPAGESSLRKHFATIIYVALGFATFFLVLLNKVPLERMSGKVLELLSQNTRLDWYAKELDFGVILGPKLTFHELSISPSLRYRARPGDPLAFFVGEGLNISEFSFRPNLFQLIPIPYLKPTNPAGSFHTNAFESDISGSFVIGKTRTSTSLQIEDLFLNKIPALRDALAIEGKVSELELDFSAPGSLWSAASGDLGIAAEALKLNAASLSSAAFIQSLGLLNLGKLVVRSTMEKGKLKLLEFTLGGPGSDLTLKLEGEVALKDALDTSQLDLVLWVTPSAKLLPLLENPLVKGLVPFTKKPNGAYAVQLKGTIREPRPLAYPGS